MLQAGEVRVNVHFAGKPPAGYIVEMKPEGGEAVGKWGGSGNLDTQNQVTFQDVLPGRYVVFGHPNPSHGDEQSASLAVELKGGQTPEVKLSAK